MYLMRPVIENLCSFESLKDGTIDLADIALMNAALMVDNENQRRINEAALNERNS